MQGRCRCVDARRMDLPRRRARPLVLLLAVAALLLGLAVAVPAAASATCGRGQTALGGSLQGAPDGAPLNASVHVELTDAATRRAYDVFTDGRVDTVGR